MVDVSDFALDKMLFNNDGKFLNSTVWDMDQG